MKPFKTTPRGDAEVAKKGVFWWRAALSYKLFKLNQATKAQVNIEGRDTDLLLYHEYRYVDVRMLFDRPFARECEQHASADRAKKHRLFLFGVVV